MNIAILKKNKKQKRKNKTTTKMFLAKIAMGNSCNAL